MKTENFKRKKSSHYFFFLTLTTRLLDVRCDLRRGKLCAQLRYCASCKTAGITRCGLRDSSVMTTRAVINHINAATHYKHVPAAIKVLIDEYKSYECYQITNIVIFFINFVI